MKTTHGLILIMTLLALAAAKAWADDLEVTGAVTGTQYYDSAEGIVFNDADLAADADVIAEAAYEVTLAPGTSIALGATFVARMKDADGLPNRWEMSQCSTLDYDPASDPDADNLTMLEELGIGTSPCTADTDGDGMPDGWEVSYSLDPLAADNGGDADNDGLNNADEYLAGTDPYNTDTDGDGLPDGWEVQYGRNPLADDSDDDPDGDGYTNATEYNYGTDPTDASSQPVRMQFDYDDNGNLESTQQI